MKINKKILKTELNSLLPHFFQEEDEIKTPGYLVKLVETSEFKYSKK